MKQYYTGYSIIIPDIVLLGPEVGALRLVQPPHVVVAPADVDVRPDVICDSLYDSLYDSLVTAYLAGL